MPKEYREGDTDATPTTGVTDAEAPERDEADDEFEVAVLLLVRSSNGEVVTMPVRDFPGLKVKRSPSIGEIYRMAADVVEQANGFRIVGETQRMMTAMLQKFDARLDARLKSIEDRLPPKDGPK